MLKNVIHTFITKVFSSAFGFLTIILISQILGAECKGEQAMIVLNIYVLMLIFTLVGNSTLIYLTPRYRFPLLIVPSFLWIGAMSVICCLFVFVFPSLIPDFALATLVIAILASLTEINQFVLLGKEKIVQANRVKMLSPLITNLLLLTFWLLDMLKHTQDFIISLTIAYLFSAAYSTFLLRKEYLELRNYKSKFNDELKQVARTMFAKGATKQFGTIVQTLNYRLIFYILAFYFGEKMVGVYSNAVSLMEAVTIFGSSLALVQYARLSNMEDRNKSNSLAVGLTLKMTKINIIVSFLAITLLCFLPSEVYIWLFGKDFSQVGYIIRLLAVGILLLSCASNFTQYFSSRGNFSISAIASFIGLAFTLLFGLLLVPAHGAGGAAIASSISFAVTALIEAVIFWRWSKKS